MKEPTPPSFGHPVQYRRVPRLDTRRRVVILRRILSCFGSAPLVNRHSRGHGERTRDRWMNLRAASSQWSPVGLRPDFPSRGEEGLSHAVWWECPPRDQQTHHGVRAARQAGQSWWAWALDVQYALALPHQPPSEACTLDSEAATGRHSSSTRTVRRRLPHRQPTTVADGRHPRGCVWHGPAAEQAPACQPSLPPPSHPSLMYYWSQTLCPRLLTLPKETLSTPPPPSTDALTNLRCTRRTPRPIVQRRPIRSEDTHYPQRPAAALERDSWTPSASRCYHCSSLLPTVMLISVSPSLLPPAHPTAVTEESSAMSPDDEPPRPTMHA